MLLYHLPQRVEMFRQTYLDIYLMHWEIRHFKLTKSQKLYFCLKIFFRTGVIYLL